MTNKYVELKKKKMWQVGNSVDAVVFTFKKGLRGFVNGEILPGVYNVEFTIRKNFTVSIMLSENEIKEIKQ